MDRFQAMRVFTRVLERRSFSAAAEDLNIPRSTATDAVKQLEARLGVRLLERTTRQVTPTIDGDAYYIRCLSIISDVEDAESAFTSIKPKGSLRVDVHGSLARHFLLPKLPAFLAEYPDIELYLSEGDRLVDLVREGIDCVLRVGTVLADDAVATQVATLEEVTVAAPKYLTKFGVPTHPNKLNGHKMVGFRVTGSALPIPLEFCIKKKVVTHQINTALMVNSAETLISAAKAGLGIIQVPRYHVAQDIAEGSLKILLPEYPPLPSPVSMLYPPNRKHSSRVRVFTDWLESSFKQKP